MAVINTARAADTAAAVSVSGAGVSIFAPISDLLQAGAALVAIVAGLFAIAAYIKQLRK